MKKKVVMGLSLLLLISSLTACGEKNSPKEVAVSESTKVSESAEKKGTGQAEEIERFDLVYTERDFGYSMTIPSGYHKGESGWGYTVYGGNMYIHITQYSGEMGDEAQRERIDLSKYEDSSDIFELLLPNVSKERFSPQGEISGYEVEELFTKEINGVEMTKFQGEIQYKSQYLDEPITYPVVAYGIAGSKTPILICAYDTNPDRRLFEEWVDKIDIMANTFVDAP